MRGFTVAGANGFSACELLDGPGPDRLTGHVEVTAGTPALVAAIGDPATGRPLAPAVARMTVTDPDGTAYETDVDTAATFAQTAGGRGLQVLCVLAPKPGTWTFAVAVAAPGPFRARCATVPAADPLASALAALAPHAPGLDGQAAAAAAAQTDALRWALWPFALLVATAQAHAGLRLDLGALIVAATGLTAAQAQVALTRGSGQAATGTAIAIAQAGELLLPGATAELLANGDAAHGLDGWTIVDHGGAGWTTQTGFAAPIGYEHCFAVSSGWCRKAQTVDLVAQGLSASYLDTAPRITVTDWIAAVVPAGAIERSSAELVVRLLDAARTPIKELRIGPREVAPSPDPAVPAWSRLQLDFSGYGPGARFVELQDGGIDPAGWDRAVAGLKLTGASATVALSEQPAPAPQLVRNGSAEHGLADWTNSSPSGNPWAAAGGPGSACPVSLGTTAFTVASGVGVMHQTVDLVAAGYQPAYLDTAPTIQVGAWAAASPDSDCTYHVTAALLDGGGSEIHRFATGDVRVPAGPHGFLALVQALDGYPAGVRSLRLELGAAPATAVPERPPAQLTGALVSCAPPPTGGPELGFAGTAVEPAAALAEAPQVGAPEHVLDTRAIPYRWICRIQTRRRPSMEGAVASGWIVRRGSTVLVVTAAHVVVAVFPEIWWSLVSCQPATGGAGPDPYPSHTSGTALQIPIEYLLDQQGLSPAGDLWDYAAFVFEGIADWPADGFVALSEDDAQLSHQPATIAGYPATDPFHAGWMYREDIAVEPNGASEVHVPTDFRGGGSGGPIFVRGTNDAVGIFSHSRWLGLFGPFATRVRQKTLDDIDRWATPLTPEDRVCELQVVIYTGEEPMAGTDDAATFTVAGNAYDIDSHWMPMSGPISRAKESSHFDGYDFSASLRQNHPDGLLLSDLVDTDYRLERAGERGWLGANAWYVSSITFFVNGQRLFTREHHRWLLDDPAAARALTGTIPAP